MNSGHSVAIPGDFLQILAYTESMNLRLSATVDLVSILDFT